MTEQDWHLTDITAALCKRGTSLARVSREAGLASSTLAHPWPKGEWLIAVTLNLYPAYIWPGRYSCCRDARLPKKMSQHKTRTP